VTLPLKMETAGPAIRDLLEALDEPAFIVERQIVKFANGPAKSLVGQAIEGSDVRLAIRHPKALDFVLTGRPGDIDFAGVGAVGRPWRLSVRPLGGSAFLLRLVDRSAAQSAEKMRVDFVADASHELRTPLSAVIGYAESLQDEGVEPETASKFAGTIETEARRMLQIIEDLMSLSRIEADRFVAPTSRVAIADTVEGAVKSAGAVAKKCGCTIQVEVEQGLPQIAGDSAELSQLVDNLLSNAVRYGCASPKCKIRISATLDGNWVRLQVSDTGPGISRDHLPFITRRFYRVDAARSRARGGTGLGLAIVKHIVERHRGELAIESSVGKGTTVTVRLPTR
jgi:two-component system phosphate regulon sensor histidine kinase PhoR